MNENTLNLIRAIAEGDAHETEKSFQAAMAEKISAKLDDMRAEVAKNMFATPEAVVEEETVEVEIEELDEGILSKVAGKLANATGVTPQAVANSTISAINKKAPSP